MAVEGKTNENNKYQFIKEIYSDSWALIIGINKYQNVDPLTYAVADAIAVKEMLVEKYGFKEDHIRLITDSEASKDNILKGFNDILTQAKEKDRVVVYYAGHGETYKLPSGGDMGYLIPVDGELDNLYLSSIPMKSIYDIAEMSYAKHILYLVDACYGGLTLNTRGLKKDVTPEYLKRMTRERGRQVITAGGKDEQVIEKPEWGHSAFTRNLIKGLGDGLADENDDGIITGDELGGFIKNRVIVDVDGAHTPQKGRIGSDMGEIVFISELQLYDYSYQGNQQITALEEEVAEMKKLLDKSNKDALFNPQPVITKRKRSINKMTVTSLSILFPGMGQLYAGNTLKGLFYSGLELASLASAATFYGNYSSSVDTYNFSQSDINQFETDVMEGMEWTQSDADSKKEAVENAFVAKNQALAKLIGTGTLAGFIWLLNIFDAIDTNSNNLSDTNNISIGLNACGQVEVRIPLK